MAAVTGCGTIAKEAYCSATRPQGSYSVLRSSGPRLLAEYDTVELAPFDNQVDYVGPGTVNCLRNEIVKECSLDKRFYSVKMAPVGDFERGGAGRTIAVTGKMVDFTSSRYSGSRIVEGADSMIVRTRILDRQTGEVLVRAIARRHVKAASAP
jgi:hypothetical protein